jgi:hypothetical protein
MGADQNICKIKNYEKGMCILINTHIYICIEIHIRFLHLEQAGHHFGTKDGSCFFATKDHGPKVI